MNGSLASFGGRTSNDVASLKITPSNSPAVKPVQKSPIRSNFSSAVLSLQKVIGTTTSTQCGFSCHEDSRRVALCAGSAVLLAEFDEHYRISQRFYRALPTASSSSHAATARPNATPDRRRSIAPGRVAVSALPASPSRELAENESFKTWTSRKRIKATSSVDISKDGRFLAVGETGYNPRVLVFSTDTDASTDIPLSIMNEHTSGIRSVAFSPDSQHLASLGDINDGFLYVYSFNPRRGLKLQCTNKCIQWVRDMAWFGNNIITVGTRHVKVWRLPEIPPISPSKSGRHRLHNELPSSPGGKALTGRNTVLGPFANFTFTCVAGLSNQQAVLCSDNGAICLVDDSEGRQELKLVKTLPWSVSSVGIDRNRKRVWFGGQAHQIHNESVDIFESLRSPSVQSDISTRSSISLPSSPLRQPRDNGSASIVAISCLDEKLVCLDSVRNLGLRDVVNAEDPTEAAPVELLTPAHSVAIEGVQILQARRKSAAFFTWSRDGNVRFWDLKGTLQRSVMLELEQFPDDDESVNELKALCASPDEAYFISGDRLGVVRIIKQGSWLEVHNFKAHASEVTSIAVAESADGFTLATAGRDRLLQLFQKSSEEFSLCQTMDEHVGAVTGVVFANDGDRLLSHSSDRTIIIRQRFTKPGAAAIYSTQRVITLKASPVSLTFHPHSFDIVVVSTMDRHILRFDLNSGTQLHSFKTSDPDDNDTVVMDSLVMSQSSSTADIPVIIAGVSSTDKSIRVFDYARDSLLTREFGHTEGVSDVALLEPSQPDDSEPTSQSDRVLVSTGLDGIIMLWKLRLPATRALQELTQSALDSPNRTPVKEFVAGKAPLRRVLSKSDLSEYTRFDPNLGATTPIRDQSPPRLRRRPSNFGPKLSSRMDAQSEDSPTPSHNSTRHTRQGSPPAKLDVPLPSLIRSPNGTSNPIVQSVGPVSALPNCNHRATAANDSLQKPSTPKLRRVSSIPNTDHHFSRSKSSSNLRAEFGTVNAAGDQTSRALKTYRKKIEICHDSELDYRILEDVEKELQMTAERIREKLRRVQKRQSSVAQSFQDSDDDEMASAASHIINSEGSSEDSQHSMGVEDKDSEAMRANEASGEG